MAHEPLTYDEVAEWLDYDPATGFLHLKKRHKFDRRAVGDVVGFPDPHGYIVLNLLRKGFKAHRIAFLLYYSRWPENDVDHINGKKGDNRIFNLREATRIENARNMKAHKDSLTGLKGVTKNKESRNWNSSIMVNGKKIHIGSYPTPQLAHEAYVEAAGVYFGQFARAA